MVPKGTSLASIPGKETIVYIDGLNLYYGALKGSLYKWLDLEQLCHRLLPGDKLVAIKYFTARAKDTPSNPGAAQRHDLYLRALRTLAPLLSIHYGNMQNKRSGSTWPRIELSV